MTKRESIIAAAKALLTGITGVQAANIYRSRVLAYSREKCPAIAIEPATDTPTVSVVPYLDWSLVLRITVIVRDDIPDQSADTIIQQIHQKIMVDVSLGGLAQDITPGPVNFEIEDADVPVGIITMQFVVSYRTTQESLA